MRSNQLSETGRRRNELNRASAGELVHPRPGLPRLMGDRMKIHRRRLLAIAVVLVSPLFSGRAVYAAHPTVRWDIVSVQPPDVRAGGHASARTNNDFKITLPGSWTFRIKPGHPQATGGGTFEIRNQAEELVNAGTYEVTGVVRFEVAPGGLNPLLIDHIGNP